MLFILAAIVLLKVIKHIFVAILSVLGLFIILVAAVGFSTYNDVMDIRERVQEETTLLVLEDEDSEVIAGIAVNPSIEPIEEGIMPLDDRNIDFINNGIEKGDKDSIITGLQERSLVVNNSLFRIITISIDVLERAPLEEIDLEMVKVPKEDMIDILMGDDVYGDITDLVMEDEDFLNTLEQNIPDTTDLSIDIENMAREELTAEIKESLSGYGNSDEQVKGVMFMLFMSSMVKDNTTESIEYLYNNYREEKIDIYPESITFSLLKLSPKQITEQVIKQVSEEHNES